MSEVIGLKDKDPAGRKTLVSSARLEQSGGGKAVMNVHGHGKLLMLFS